MDIIFSKDGRAISKFTHTNLFWALQTSSSLDAMCWIRHPAPGKRTVVSAQEDQGLTALDTQMTVKEIVTQLVKQDGDFKGCDI